MSAARSVKPGLTSNRERGVAETLATAKRFVRAVGRRTGESDEVDLAAMLALRSEVEEAIEVAVKGMRDQGHSWAYIASGLGVSRQAAQMRYGKACREE